MTPTQNNAINRIARGLHGFISEEIRASYAITEFEAVALEGGKVQLVFHVRSERWFEDDMFGAIIIGKRGGFTKYSYFNEHCLGNYEGAKAAKKMERFCSIYAPKCKVNH